MKASLPAGLVVHAVLGDERDVAVVSDWAARSGFEAVRAADDETAIEGALESGRPALIVLDARSAMDALVDLRTLIALGEHPVGFLLACAAEDWQALAGLEVPGIEAIRRPIEPGELAWRAAGVLGRVASGRAARLETEVALGRAAALLAPGGDAATVLVDRLADWFRGTGFAAARWRRAGGDLFDVDELARVGDVRPDWVAVRDACRGGAVVSAVRSSDASVLARLLPGIRGAAFIGVPVLDEDGTPRGAVVAWTLEGWGEGGDVEAALRIAAARLGWEARLLRLREQSRRLEERDALTRLANRAQFNERLEEVVRGARGSSERCAVLVVNLDRFKTVNEAFGHAAADRVLVESARRVRQTVRGTDLVARYAGDEFAICLRELRARADAEIVATKLRAALAEPIGLGGDLEVRVTASIGICHFPDDAADAEDLVRQADIALRAGKGLGSDQTHVFVADLRDSRRERAALEARLREAEARGELRLHFQPQVSARDEDIVGIEALVRWEHPEMGMVSPGFFIPLAEETGLIVPIGRWVLFEACRQARAWQQRFGLPLRIAVNLSAVQLGRRELVDDVTAALAETGLPPDTLELEVTESVSVKRIPHLIESLEALRSLGCQIAIDDFGTGQASLDYIRRFPADRIKIDQVFVRNIGVDPDDEAIVRATIGMAHSLGRHVVAEGVEYEQHAAFLREQGCDELQGFLFCRPLPVEALEELLAERERLLAERR
jgi:diguanylate cyclase (GGDEF)-like protein